MHNSATIKLITFILLALPCVAVAQQSWPPSQLDDEGKSLREAERSRYAARMSATARMSGVGENIDVTYYALDINILPTTQMVRGSVEMHARALVPVQSVTLDVASALVVDSVVVNGAAMVFQQSVSDLSISLDRPYAAGETFAAKIYYGGQPVSSGFGSFAFAVSGGQPWVWTLSEPYGARGWWPCKDHPSDKADSVDVRITCPTGITAVSQGVLVSTTDNGDGTTTFHWKHRYPITTYLVSLAIANYDTFSDWYRYSETDSMEVVNYLLPGYPAATRNNIGRTPEMLEIYSELFGQYPFVQEKYGHAQFGWGGAMEHQTISSMGSFSVSIIAHELTHQWFGDMISPRFWRDIWLNEGFATYGVALYFERSDLQTTYNVYMANQMIAAFQAQGTLSVADTSSVGSLFSSSLVYSKGATVLHMLRRVLGDSVFFAGLRAYADDPRFRFNVATTEDLQDAFESVSGKDLSYFFSQWVYGEKYPRYHCSWTTQPDGAGHRISLTVSQTTNTSNPSVFTMPMDLYFTGESADTLFTVWNSSNDTTYEFVLPFLPAQFTLDPNNSVLKTVQYANDGEAIPITFALAQNYPNPFNPGTTIEYFVPPTTTVPGTDAHVTLKVFDLLGREVATLVDEPMPFGTHTAVWDAGNVPSGVYLYRLTSGSFSTTRRMIVLK